MKQGKLFIIFLGAFIIINACSKTEENEIFEATADAYYLSKVRGDSVVVGTVYYAFANKPMVSGVVNTPGQQSVQLNKTIENGYTIFYEPYETDFDTIYSPQGECIFDVESNDGDKLQVSDELQKVGLWVPEILSIVYENEDQSYDIQWKSSLHVEAFKVNLFNENREIVFVSEVFESGDNTFTLIEHDNGTWFEGVNYGNKYIVQVQVMNFDDDYIEILDNQNAQEFNIQEMAVAEKSFYWNRIAN